MSPTRLILASLKHHWRIQVAVTLGVVAGTAVLTGALLVGDSMRGSLRALTLDRLGPIDDVLVPGRFFRQALADELDARPDFQKHFAAAVPVVLLPASVENPGLHPPRQANQVQLVGCDDRFWSLDSDSGGPGPNSREIVLNRPLADQLGIKEGQSVMLRLPRIGAIPADTPLGRKTETVTSFRVKVQRIVPAEGLGRFGLDPTQHLPLLAFVPIDWLAERLERPGMANTLLVAGTDAEQAPSAKDETLLQQLLDPSLADIGIRVAKTPRGYLNITSDRMLFAPATEEAIDRKLAGLDVQPALSYLANTIACGNREIPYSIVTAVDFRESPPLGPIVSPDGKPIGPLDENQIVLNRWAADQLDAKPGQTIRLTYFEPESDDGAVKEKTTEFRLAAVAELSGAAADPDFTPEVKGVTDQLTMADWNPPFPFDAGRIRDVDEHYWDEHRATPKAFVSLAAGRRLWSSRFGDTTSIRLAPPDGMTAVQLARRIRPNAADLGFVFQPVKRQGLAASTGATAFDGLFLALSFFVIVAAIMLVALLFRLGVDSRASQIGLLSAVGFRRRRIAGLLLAEGFVVAALGSLFGIVAGVGYAALMLAGLRTWWLGAVVTPFLRLFVEPRSLAIGYVGGVGVAIVAIAWAVWRAGRLPVPRLLAGQIGRDSMLVPARRGWASVLAWAMLLGAVALAAAGAGLRDEAQAGIFFGAGSMVLAATLILLAARLRRGATGPAVAPGRGNLVRLAFRNAARNPGRSTLTVGLVASACFLIISMSAFRVDPASQAPNKDSGNGGFSIWAESTQPIYYDLDSEAGRRSLGFSDDDNRLLDQSTVYSVRVRKGEDASCLNLYQPREPTLLGLPKAFIARGGFQFAAATGDTKTSNPWELLEQNLGFDEAGRPQVPVAMDATTAQYSLHIGLGDSLTIADTHGNPLRAKVVGLLKTSVFQGKLLTSDDNLLRYFPETGGFRIFLVESPQDRTVAIEQALRRSLSDYGLAAETTGQRLAGFLIVQNTYLSTFQTLGALGLILGTFGLAAVELRNVMERRGELALLRATGFRRRSLAALILLENSALLMAGLACGVVAAAVAVLPHLLAGGASIPWGSLVVTLGVVLAVGTLAAQTAVRAVVAAPLLAGLRDE